MAGESHPESNSKGDGEDEEDEGGEYEPFPSTGMTLDGRCVLSRRVLL